MKKIVLLYNRALIPSVRLCGYEQLTYLSKRGIVEFDSCPSEMVTRKQLRDADAVIFVRSDSNYEVALSKKLKKAGKYLFYVMDDDLLNIPAYISSAEYYNRPYVNKNIQDLMKYCNCFLTPSEKLAQKYGDRFEKTIIIEEPALCKIKHEQVHQGPVKIGFAGSIDRGLDFDQILAGALRKVIDELKDAVSIEFVGAKPAIAGELNCKWSPYQESYEGYQKIMESVHWDIGLAPMPDSDFHACKHYNKFIEYGSYGIISICSNVTPYTRIVNNGHNGIMCDNTVDSWANAIISLVGDTEKRRKISENLFDEIEQQFQVPVVAKKFWEDINPVIPELSIYVLGPTCGIYVKHAVMRIINIVKLYGWRTPFFLVTKLKKKLLAHP